MRGFDDTERARIEAELIETGRKLLLRYGPKKTNVADITEPVGIAKSTFYRFFDSKAELYMEIYLHEVEEFTDHARSKLEGVETTEEGLETLFRSYTGWIEESAFIQRMFIQSDYQELYRTIPDERLAEIQGDGLEAFEPLLEVLEACDGELDDDVDLISLLGIMSSIGLLVLHREEFEEYDPDYYERIRDLLISALAGGLVVES
jgi:AcrR family transcriptional regulator